MDQEAFKKIARALSVALVDDFRGFLVEGTKRVEVPEDMLHLQIAYQELLKVPGWKYESGTGQNPIVEYLQIKKARKQKRYWSVKNSCNKWIFFSFPFWHRIMEKFR